MLKHRRLVVLAVMTLVACFLIGTRLAQKHNPAAAAATSWNPAVSCVPVVTTIEAIVGTQTNSNGGATQAGGWYGGQTIPDKNSLTPPCTVNGAPMFVELHNVNVEGMQCNSFTGGNDGDCWGNLWDNSSGPMTLLNQIHAEIAGTWITAGIAPSVPATNTQVDIQGFVYWDTGHLTDSWHSYSGWEIHPVSAWRATTTNDFSMSLSPASGSVATGGSTTSTVSTAVTGGSAQQLSLSATGLPSGATAAFSPASITTGASSTMTITTSSSTPAGSYNVTVVAAGSSVTHTAVYTLTVNGSSSTAINNGGFETGSLSPWTVARNASITTSSPHSGTYAAMVGKTTSSNGDSSISQSFTAPAGGGTLTFWYSIYCNDTVSYDWGTATLADNTAGTTATPLPQTCPSSSSWKQASATLTGGDYYTLTLINHDDNSPNDPSWTEYDDVAIQAAPNTLAAPTGVTATATSSSAITVSWTAVPGATSYTVQRSPDGSTGWTTVGTPTTTSFGDSSLAAATTYYYRVSASGSGGTSPYSAVASATTQLNPPSTPTGLTATTASASEIDLSWTAASGATGYTVQRSPDGSTGWTTIATPTATSYADTPLNAATTYYYRVAAGNSAGSSAYSATASSTTAPLAPTGVTATATSSSAITVSWTAVSGATSYTVQRSPDGSTGWTTVATPTSTSFGDSSLAAATTYYYRVSASNGSGTSLYSMVASATTQVAPPPAPTGLTATTASASEIDLSWSAASGATGYTVQRSPDGSTGWTTIASPTATSYADTLLNAATTYYYRVAAGNSAGSSAYSTTVSSTTAPLAPTGLTATASAPNTISLQWNDVTGETGFTVQRSPDGATWATLASVGAHVTTYSDTGLTTGATFYYRVFAVDSGGSSAPSATASATVTGPPPAAPATPTGLSATTISASEIDLQWQAASGATGYRLERSPDGSTGWTAVYTGALTSDHDLGLSAGTTYYYRVFATNSAGDSAPSSVVSATTLPMPPAAPTNPSASATSPSQIVVSWSDVAGETGFTVQRSPNGTDTWVTAGTTPQGITTFTNSGLAPSTTYYYRVIATNAGGSSAPSGVVSATTLSGAPATPTGLRAAALSTGSATLSWAAVSGASSYQVQRSPDGSTGWSTVGTPAQASFTDSGLAAATSYFYRVTATNSSGTSAPSTSVSVTTDVALCPCTAWAPSVTPTVPAVGDTSANELGVKFRVDVSGTITGVRFYKSSTNTGTHTAHLWSRTGTLLGSATFTNETASGWQQVTFGSPIAVTAGTTYVASYFAPAGHYAADQNYFATQGVNSGPLHLLANNVDGADGVYKQTTSGFPTYTYRASNYWVDVVFSAGQPAAPTSVAASAQPAGQITVSWAAVTGASGYRIYYSADGATNWTVVGSTSGTSWVDVRPTPGVADYYRVTAISAGGESNPSTVVSAVPTG